MQLSLEIANHFKGVYFGGNWTSVSLKSTLTDISFATAQVKIENVNSVLGLTAHIHYYIKKVTEVLEGEKLEASDKESFELPLVNSQAEWEIYLAQIWEDGMYFYELLKQMDDDVWEQTFEKPEYGTYYSNIHGIIEHIHYHLGQITLLNKLVNATGFTQHFNV